MDDEIGWELRSATKGRPYRIGLPPDLSEYQLDYIRSRLPSTWKLSRQNEPIGHAESKLDYEQTIKLATDRAELELQVLSLIEQKRTLHQEIKKLERLLHARKKRAKSFACALNEVLSDLNINIPEGADNG